MGWPKAWLDFGGERLLERVARQVGAATGTVVVVAAVGQDLPPLPGSVRVVRDAEVDQGPLRGFATGLAALPATIDLAFVAGTDAPFLHPGWVDRLASLLGDRDCLVPEVAGRRHPLGGVYRVGPTLAAADGLLAAGERRLTRLVDRLGGHVAREADLVDLDPTLATLRNVNTPAEYRAALAAAGLDSGAGDGGEPTGLPRPGRPR